MIEIVPDILRFVQPVSSAFPKAINLNTALSTYPLNFQFYYGKNNQEEVFNTIYLEDGNPKSDLCLKLFNQSSTKSVTFKRVEETISAAGPTQCHFYIQFEKDLQLKPKEISVEPKDQWQVNYLEEKDFFTFYFIHKQGLILKPKGSSNNSDRVLLTIKNLSANNRMVKSSNVELIYGPLLLNGEGISAPQFTNAPTCKNAISIINHPGKKNIPLQFRFIGPNTILNDGTTSNSLKLKIFNRPLSGNSRPNLLLDKANSKFIVSFEANDNSEALTTLARANSTQITPSGDWTQQKTQNEAKWTIQLKSTSTKDILKTEEGFELDIKNLVTSSASGVAYLYITYQNIGDYPDGQLVVPIEKTPLLYREQRVGIGTNNPKSSLEISVNVTENTAPVSVLTLCNKSTVSGAALAIDFYCHNADQYKNFAPEARICAIDSNWSSHLTFSTRSPGYYTYPLEERLRIQDDGNVGIGTTSPSEKLEVNGNLKVAGDLNFGESTRQMINLWKKEYGIGIQSGTQYFRGWSFAWHQGGTHSYTAADPGEGGKLLMRIDGDGNVGIGTKSPSAKLHVNGRIKDKTGWVMPVGSILPYAASTAPEGWFLCDGSAKDKTTYADLFNVISTKYGGSGNNFNLPNFKGRIPVGLSGDTEFNSLGKTGGSKTHTLTEREMPTHTHGVNDPGHQHTIKPGDNNGQGVCDDASGGGRSDARTENAKTKISLDNTGGGQAHNNLQPYITVNYIIKY